MMNVWPFVLLIACAAAIYLSCEWFVNAIEWLGHRLNVDQKAVGTILAAFGTALPETAVTLIAVSTGGTTEARNIGVGAAMGGPLALATVAYGVTGLTLLAKRRQRKSGHEPNKVFTDPADATRLAKDQGWFIAVFAVKVTLGLVAFTIKPWFGLLFFAVYVVYFWREMRGSEGSADPAELEPLKLQRRVPLPATWAIVAQTLGALAVVFISSQLFVRQLDTISQLIGLSSALTALLLSPIATELPEIMNAIIWVRQGKTRLALANISGSMMIQATVPSGLGLLFTQWRFDNALILSGAITMIAIGYLLITLRAGKFTPTRLAVVGLLYLCFAGGLIPILIGHW